MPSNVLDIVDPATGELVGGSLRIARPRKRVAPYREYIIVNKDTDVSDIKSASTLRLYLKLQHILGYENGLQINQTVLGKQLGMKPQQVWRALKELLDREIVLKSVEDGVKLYQMNPNLMWRGSAHSFDQTAGRNESANR